MKSFSPYISILIVLTLLVVLTENSKKAFSVSAVIVITPFILISLFTEKNTIWSPYQKLSLVELPPNPILPPGKMLNVNNIGYMGLLDLSNNYDEVADNKLKQLTLKNYSVDDLKYRNQYDLPYYIKTDAQKVLLIGAGAGNDAAGAIRSGVNEVVAVEIDPQIIEFGRHTHPENPYESAKVAIVNDDGRSFLRKTTEKFDVVVMGLTDSHTLNSNLTNIQLDNYLYTIESMREIYDVLNNDGILFLSFDVRRDYIGQRLQKNITEVFKQTPYVFSMQQDPPVFGWGGVFFVAGRNKEELDLAIASDMGLESFIKSRAVSYSEPTKMLTDNWPFLYLQKPKIPAVHLYVSLILIAVFITFAYKFKIVEKLDTKAFLLGVGFLLYEFQNIGKTSLLYGNTWVTNVFIISAILCLILLSNFVGYKIKINNKLVYILLVVTFLFQIITPVSFYNNFSEIIKYIFVPVLLNLPLFFSGLLFINLFSKANDKKVFFASNLLGSTLGGLLSFVSYIFGITSLLYVSLLAYIFSIFVKQH